MKGIRTAATIGLAAVLLTGCGGATGHNVNVAKAPTTSPSTTTSTTTTTTVPQPPQPHPKGTFTHDCNYLLGNFKSNDPGGFRFVADARLHNTGNVGLVMEVKVGWLQAGSPPITETKKVRLPVGGRRTARFTYLADSNQIDLVQAVSGHDCFVHASYIDTFGTPR